MKKNYKNMIDYKAKLVIHGIEDMTSVPYRKLVDWLEKITKELKKSKVGDKYAKIATWKLMK